MRTIMFSSERITANSLEAGFFILFLLVFALAAAWHVLTNGLKARLVPACLCSNILVLICFQRLRQ
jgi:cation-transporting ATPase 13A1